MPAVIDYTAMKPGRVLLRYGVFTQSIELCPVCGRPGKPRCTPAGRQWVHRAVVVGGVFTRNEVARVVRQ